jgi:Gas vesicle synthesis protein GvpL/GvpF
VLHLYALVRQPGRLPETAGIDDRPLRAVNVAGRIDAVVSDTSSRAPTPTESAILAHAHVVEALAGSNDAILPARFGSGLADDGDLLRRLEHREEQLLAALDRVDGCTEVGLRVVPANGDGGQDRPQSGREYMQRRLNHVARAESLAGELHESLARLARDSTQQVLARPDVVLTAAYLLPREQVGTFRAAVADAERKHTGLMLVSTGPWPPYSFALLDADGR